MASRTHLAALLAAALLAGSPAVAVAQTPGDEQYQDPFGDQVPQDEATPESERDTEASQDEDGDDPAPLQGTPPGFGDEPAEPAEPAPAEEPEPSSGTEATPAPAELPNTGADAGLVGLAGLGMVLCGTGLRLRLRPHGQRPA